MCGIMGYIGNKQGGPLPALQDVMGHQDVHTTMRYAHATDEGRRRVVNALEKGSQQGNVSTIWPQAKTAAG